MHAPGVPLEPPLQMCSYGPVAVSSEYSFSLAVIVTLSTIM